MQSATVTTLKKEMRDYSQNELIELCLRLSKFKKENKELLTYLLFEASDEANYIKEIKLEIDESFETINTSSIYYTKKSLRKILRNTKKYIRYSKKKETEAELLLYFCMKMRGFYPSVFQSKQMVNLYEKLLSSISKSITSLHEDLQYDFAEELEMAKDY